MNSELWASVYNNFVAYSEGFDGNWEIMLLEICPESGCTAESEGDGGGGYSCYYDKKLGVWVCK